MNARGLMIVTVCLFSLGHVPGAWSTEKKLHSLEGTWKAVAAENGGEAEPKENLEKARLTIAGDKVRFQEGDIEIEGTIQVDEGQTPKTFDATFSDESRKYRVLGIFNREGDVVTMCFVLEPETRPTEFTTSQNSSTIVVWQRVQP